MIKKRNRLIALASGIIILICCSLLALNIWIGRDVSKNIDAVRQQYEGSAEDALIAFLLNEVNSPKDRTHTAIWTLGRIRSEKALPLLKELYLDDPRGESCFGKHDSLLCQYEIHKAIQAIEKPQFFSHARFNR